MAEEIGSLEIQISASVNEASKSIDTLCKKLTVLNKELIQVGKTSSTFLSDFGSQKGISSGFAKLQAGFTKINGSLTKTSKSANSFSLGVKNIAKGIAPVVILTKGFKELKESIMSTTDYIESLNYFNVALGKVASEWSNEYSKYGYENAQAYGESFTERLSQTLGKLSGVKLELDSEGKGLLSESGMKNLGINIQEVTQYAAQLASVTNSLGLTGEATVAVSKSMTMLAGDLSSLKDESYESVAKNLQSGLIGQSKALYKFGIDITNATLQTYAYNLGLSKAVSEMTQAEKMQLRMLAILDQSKVAWGDLANTINSPANMIRQFTNNLKETGLVIGQLFIPLLQKVLPIINGVTIAMKRLFVNIAGFLGVKVDLDSFGQGYTDLEDSIDDITGAYDDAAGAAKKFKTITLGIDELNINAPQTESGSGVSGGGSIDLTDEILKATEEYEKVWNAAYEKMENMAQNFADKISGSLKPISDMFKNLFSGNFELAGGNLSEFFTQLMDGIKWEGVFEKARNFGTGLSDFLNGLLAYDGDGRTLFGKVAQTLANTLNTIVYAAQAFATEFDFYQFGVNLGDALNNFFETFDFKAAADTLNKWVDGLKETIKGFIDTADWGTVWQGIKDFFGELELDTIAVIIGGFTLKYLGKTLTGFMLKNTLTNKFSDIAKAAGLSTGTAALGTALCAIEVALVLSQFTKDFNDWKTNIETYGWDEGRKKTAEENQANPYIDDSEYNKKLDEMRQRWDNLRTYWATNNKANPYVEDSEYNKKLNEVRQNWDSVRRNWAENNKANPYIETSEYNRNIEEIRTSWENMKSSLSQKWDGMELWFSENVSIWFTKEQWSTLWENVKSAFSTKWEEIKTWWNESAIGKWWNTNVMPWFTKKKWEDTMKGVKEAFSTTWEGAISSIKEIWNKFATWLNEKLTWTIDPVVVLGKTVFPGTTINLGKIPTFEVGGFPEDGLFMANHNELVGQFSNGRTAVANNEMITAGIEEAAYRGFARAYAENSREADLLVELIGAVREGKTIAIDGRELVSAIDERNKRNGFSFA